MGKSLPRMCRACGTKLKGDFNKHVKQVCRRKHGFKGWIYFDRKGKRVDEDNLPARLTRVVDASDGMKIGTSVGAPEDECAKAWRKIKRSSILATYNKTVRANAFKHFVKTLLLDSKRFTEKLLFKLIREAA